MLMQPGIGITVLEASSNAVCKENKTGIIFGKKVGLPKNTEHPIKFEFLINNEYTLRITMSHAIYISRHNYSKKLLTVYLKLYLTWHSVFLLPISGSLERKYINQICLLIL